MVQNSFFNEILFIAYIIVVNLAIEEKDESYEGTTISRKIDFKGELTDEQIKRLLIIADKCPIHKVLSNPIKIITS